MIKARVLYVPTASHTKRVFRPESFERFRSIFEEVKINETGKNYTSEQLAEEIAGYDALVTGWGAPKVTPQVMENADKLKIIAHSAGSVRALLGDVIERYIIPRGICICHSRHAIAYNVAEHTIGLMIMCCRRIMDHALAFREKGVWRDPNIPSNGQFLRGSTVGIVSASAVGREVIKLLRPFDVKILVYDPYLSEYDAGKLGVDKVSLEDLFARSDIVTVHAPSLPETWGMINEKHLKLLRDGAVLVNTARGKIIDHAALLKECQTGRIIAALDVTDPEPLPSDSPFRDLPNVIITPHMAGAGYYGYFRIGDMTLQALMDFFTGKTPVGVIDPSEFFRLA
jgi:phosphoglycerate dehydrogenase-like enzyme